MRWKVAARSISHVSLTNSPIWILSDPDRADVISAINVVWKQQNYYIIFLITKISVLVDYFPFLFLEVPQRALREMIPIVSKHLRLDNWANNFIIFVFD